MQFTRFLDACVFAFEHGNSVSTLAFVFFLLCIQFFTLKITHLCQTESKLAHCSESKSHYATFLLRYQPVFASFNCSSSGKKLGVLCVVSLVLYTLSSLFPPHCWVYGKVHEHQNTAKVVWQNICRCDTIWCAACLQRKQTWHRNCLTVEIFIFLSLWELSIIHWNDLLPSQEKDPRQCLDLSCVTIHASLLEFFPPLVSLTLKILLVKKPQTTMYLGDAVSL